MVVDRFVYFNCDFVVVVNIIVGGVVGFLGYVNFVMVIFGWNLCCVYVFVVLFVIVFFFVVVVYVRMEENFFVVSWYRVEGSVNVVVGGGFLCDFVVEV